MRLLDGYAVIDDLGIIYYVIGLPSKNGVWAYPKYLPDPSGDRIINDRRYKKLSKPIYAIKQIKSIKPDILTKTGITIFPFLKYDSIKQIFDPRITLQELIKKDDVIKELVYLITARNDRILQNLGITGSRLIGINTPDSDIDLIFYGHIRDAKRIYQQLKKLRIRGLTKPIHGTKLKKLWKDRSDTPIDYKFFKSIEKRKIVQGIFKDYMYSIKLFDYTAWRQGTILGVTSFKGIILDDSRSMLFPPSYLIEPLEVIEGKLKTSTLIKVISYRSRFWEVASKGTKVIVKGVLESLNDDFLVTINHEYGMMYPLQ